MEKEKGFNGEPYTKIPNQILEVLLQIKLQNYEIRLLLAIARKTYGFNKNSDYINQKQLENLTGIKQSNISRTLKNLIEKKMIIKNGKQLSIQKDFKLWNVAEKEILINISDEIYFSNSKENENISDGICKYILPDIKNIPDKIYTNKTINKTDTKKNIYSQSDPVSNFFAKEKNKELANQVEEIFDHWNSKNIITHRKLTDKVKGKINAKIKEGYSIEEIKQTIDNYCLILSGEEYFFSYRWTLEEFLQKGFEKFKDFKIAKSNYLIKEARSARVKKHFEQERDYTDDERRAIEDKFYS